MAVGLKAPVDLYPVAGFKLGVACAGIKKENRKDLVVMQFPVEASVAGIFTKNAFCAAPVIMCKQHLSQAQPMYCVINTGNANAGTGKQGELDVNAVCTALSERVGIEATQVLPFSTGVIGEPLPKDKIIQALPHALADLKEDNWLNAATGIMTTDTVPKGYSVQFQYQNETITVTGISKGAGMICPNMATMLGFIATDAKVAPSILQHLIAEIADKTFNRISVDGDTSTNDSFLMVATGQVALSEVDDETGEYFNLLKKALHQVAEVLAQSIVRDGEGATKFVTVQVNGGRTGQECLDVAYAIAHSPLIKTALFASDPNWGRILAAVGYAGLEALDVGVIDIYLGDVQIVKSGSLAETYTEQQGVDVMSQPEIMIQVDLKRGACNETIWTTDLSHEYVRINAEYRS